MVELVSIHYQDTANNHKTPAAPSFFLAGRLLVRRVSQV